MKSINILITAIGGDIGSNIIKILKMQNSIKFNIYGTDINDRNFSIDEVFKFYKVSRANTPEYGKQIVEIAKENFINLIIPTSEFEILWFSNNVDLFENLNIKVLINNNNIISNFLNKFKTSIVLNDIKINTPKTYLFSEYKNELKFPLILKTISSIYGKDLYIIKNEQQLNYLQLSIENHKNYIIQEYIGSIDEEYTTTVYKNKNRLEVITFKRKLTGGMTSYAEIVDEKILKEYAVSISKTFNLQGSINIQSRKLEDKFYIFEINPRFSSTIYIRDYFGFKDLLWWIEDCIDCKFCFDKIVHKDIKYAILGYKYKFF